MGERGREGEEEGGGEGERERKRVGERGSFTSAGAELRDKENGGVISSSGSDVSLLGLAYQQRLTGIIDGQTIVLQGFRTAHRQTHTQTQSLLFTQIHTIAKHTHICMFTHIHTIAKHTHTHITPSVITNTIQTLLA